MQEILENLRAAFVPFGFIDALEIILFALIFYYVFRILKNSNVRFMIALFTILVLVTGVIFVFNTELNGEVFMIIPVLLAGLVKRSRAMFQRSSRRCKICLRTISAPSSFSPTTIFPRRCWRAASSSTQIFLRS